MRPRFGLWLAFVFVVVVLDQLSKQIVLAQLVPGESIPVTGFFNLVLLFNRARPSASWPTIPAGSAGSSPHWRPSSACGWVG